MKKNWITANKPNWEGCLASPIGVPNVIVPLVCVATDTGRLIYATSDKYDGQIHTTRVVENEMGDFYVYGLFVSFRPWAWDKNMEITEYSHIKVHVNKTYGCYVNTSSGRVYVNTLMSRYFEKKGRYEAKKYTVVKTQSGKFGYLIPNDGKYR